MSLSLTQYKEKLLLKEKDKTVTFSVYPWGESSDPWNSWALFVWDYDPFKYAALRKSICILLYNYWSKKFWNKSSFVYLLDRAEYNDAVFYFSYGQSNIMSSSILGDPRSYDFFAEPQQYEPDEKLALGALEVTYWLGEFFYVPSVYFEAFRVYLLAFYRNRTDPRLVPYTWGERYSFRRVPTYIWKLNHKPGVLRKLWTIPEKYYDKWTLRESVRVEYARDFAYNNTGWWKMEPVMYNWFFYLEDDASNHEFLLSQMKRFGLGKTRGELFFFRWFFLRLKHMNHAALAFSEPHFFKWKYYIFFDNTKDTLFFKKEGDLVRMYFYWAFLRFQLGLDSFDRVADHVLWLEYISEEYTFSPFQLTNPHHFVSWSYLRKMAEEFHKKINIPFFSKIKKKF